MKKVTALILCLCLVFANLPPALADDSDIFGVNIQPNIMILFDDSGSMADSVPNNIYVASTTYTVVNQCSNGGGHGGHGGGGGGGSSACTSTVVYQQGGGGFGGGGGTYTLYANTIASVANASAQTALSTTGYWTGQIGGSNLSLFLGNYLNYQLGTCTSCEDLEPKINIAHTIVTNIVNSTTGVRFGLATFSNTTWDPNKWNPLTNSYGVCVGGAQILAPIGSSAATIVSAVNNLEPQGCTPLGEALQNIGQYYAGTFPGYSSPIQYACQTNFVILVTDGIQNGVVDMRVQATLLYTTDASANYPGLQNVITDTVGFGVEPPDQVLQATADLQTTATNGGGYFYLTTSAGALEAALQGAIAHILAATFSFATPAIPTTSTTGDTRVYMAALQSNVSSPFWQGYLTAYNRNSSGVVPVDSNGHPLASAQAWEAGQVLTTIPSANRTIYTLIGGTLQAFNTSNANLTPALLGVSTAAQASNVINFIRGQDVFGANPALDRSWKLGDIFHSNPVVVFPPFQASADPTYTAFKTANAGRTTVVLVGANDGMLHAFRESDGTELWAFIPPDLLSQLQNLTLSVGPHNYYVDSSPIVADIQIGGAWKTIVVFGERRGGPNYYALDITNTTSPAYLWNFTDSHIVESWSEPAIGAVQMAGGTTKYVAFLGGGFDTAQNNAAGKNFFVVDLATGLELWKYYNNSSTGDQQYMNFSLAANATAVDLNNDGFVDHVYIGDVGGQLWKFDVSAPATLSGGLVTNWLGKRLFVASPTQANPPPAGAYYPAQAIFDAPALAYDSQNNLWVFFGTGDRDHPENTSSNSFYGIIDNTNMTNGSALTASNLVNVTSTNVAPTQGWFITLQPNEKDWTAPSVFNYVVLFTTFTPTSDPCGAGGNANLYEVQMGTGYAALNWSTGLPLSSSNSSNTRNMQIGVGIPSQPIVEITSSGGTVTSTAIAATTSQQLTNNAAPPPSSMKQFLYWTERF